MADVASDNNVPRQEMRDSQTQADDEERSAKLEPTAQESTTEQELDQASPPDTAEGPTEQQQQTGTDNNDISAKNGSEGAQEVPVQPDGIEDTKEELAGDAAGDDSQAQDSFEHIDSSPPSDEAEVNEEVSNDATAPVWAANLIASVIKMQSSLDGISTRLEAVEGVLGDIREAPSISTALVKSGKHVTPDKPRVDSDPFLNTIHIEVLRAMSLLTSHVNAYRTSEEVKLERHDSVRRATWGLRRQLMRIEEHMQEIRKNMQLGTTSNDGGGVRATEATIPRHAPKTATDDEGDAGGEAESQNAGSDHHITVVDAEAGPGPSTAVPTGPRSNSNNAGGRGGRGRARGRGRGRRGRGRGPRGGATESTRSTEPQAEQQPIVAHDAGVGGDE